MQRTNQQIRRWFAPAIGDVADAGAVVGDLLRAMYRLNLAPMIDDGDSEPQVALPGAVPRPVLAAMEDEGLIDWVNGDEAHSNRRSYLLTAEGRRAARRLAEWPDA